MGTSSFLARVGGSGSTLIPLMASIHKDVPYYTFGILGLISAVLPILLPETGNMPLPATMAEIEERHKKRQNAAI